MIFNFCKEGDNEIEFKKPDIVSNICEKISFILLFIKKKNFLI